ncbi:Ecto-NOX disulfide-thiol exchanger 1 like protein [Argiope bruennichi]|uniref:Ecto-NOX disulfide-thiol exchanger 1 like protein n=2 Tax=Argiope bruennichi TaxID=94029 RepID=A0A8T0FNT3_ARGBR|nr:Ecto-NOX disulfide-thiol exchanger 1 like protein [Argiope bruennichi]
MLNTENETVNADAQTESQVSHLSVKIPPLWRNNIKLWFIQVESNFALAKITNDLTKYNHLIATIDPETLSAVADILLAPPDTNKYDALKTRLIAEFSASENEQIRRLLSELHLGADKPSQLLRKMRELGGGTGIKDDFLKTLWLQRLPSEMQAILSISSERLDNLANMVDKIAEVRISSTDSSVFVVSRSAESNAMRKASTLDEFTALRSEIAALSKQVKTPKFSCHPNVKLVAFPQTRDAKKMEKNSKDWPPGDESKDSSHDESYANAGRFFAYNSVPRYSEEEAQALAKRLDNKNTFQEAMKILISWLESGECNESNSTCFHFLIQLCWNRVEKLQAEKKEYQEEIKRVDKNVLSRNSCIQHKLTGVEEIFSTIKNKTCGLISLRIILKTCKR